MSLPSRRSGGRAPICRDTFWPPDVEPDALLENAPSQGLHPLHSSHWVDGASAGPNGLMKSKGRGLAREALGAATAAPARRGPTARGAPRARAGARSGRRRPGEKSGDATGVGLGGVRKGRGWRCVSFPSFCWRCLQGQLGWAAWWFLFFGAVAGASGPAFWVSFVTLEFAGWMSDTSHERGDEYLAEKNLLYVNHYVHFQIGFCSLLRQLAQSLILICVRLPWASW